MLGKGRKRHLSSQGPVNMGAAGAAAGSVVLTATGTAARPATAQEWYLHAPWGKRE